jgi:hypothetical protein
MSASIIAVLQMAATVLSYLRDVKDASGACKSIVTEISLVRGVLVTLQEVVKDSKGEEWAKTITSLDDKSGPLSSFRDLLNSIETELKKTSEAVGLRRLAKSLQWPFRKDDTEKLLGRLHRQKTLLILALENDHVTLSRQIYDDTKAIRKGVAEMHSILLGMCLLCRKVH